jgi:hypothetical protein
VCVALPARLQTAVTSSFAIFFKPFWVVIGDVVKGVMH